MKPDMTFVKCFLIFIVAVLSVHGATLPGVIVRINDNGLEYVDSIAVPILVSKLKTTTIKDLTGEAGTPLGSIDYELSNIRNTGASIQSSTFKTVAGIGVDLGATNIHVSFTGDWHYREDHWPHISDSGSFDISASGLSFNVLAKLGTEKGRPTISTTSCSATINDVSIKFHGGASWLYNLFKSKIEDSLKSRLRSLICQEATKAINEDAAEELATFPVREKIDKVSLIDYSLVQPPGFTANYMNASLKGEILSASHPNESTIKPNEIPGNQPCNKMICIYLTDYVWNTASEVYYKAGELKTTVTASEIPKSSPYQLNTKIFINLLLKRLYDEYPNRPLQLVLYCTERPEVKTQSTGVNLFIRGNVEIYVVLKNSSTKYLFTLGTNITATGSVIVNGTIIQGSVSKFNLVFSVVKSDVGNIKPNIGLLNVLLDTLAKKTIIDALNTKGKKGLPLPSVDNVQFINTEVHFGEHVMSLDTDLKYLGKAHRSNAIVIH